MNTTENLRFLKTSVGSNQDDPSFSKACGKKTDTSYLDISIILLLSLLMASCAGSSPFQAGGEWADPATAALHDELITHFDWSKLPDVVTSIDNDEVGAGYKMAKLLPGRHFIKYTYHTAAFGANPSGVIELDLAKGHSYEFNLKLCFWCMPRKYAAWVEDTTVNQIVWGRQPDWPSWYL